MGNRQETVISSGHVITLTGSVLAALRGSTHERHKARLTWSKINSLCSALAGTAGCPWPWYSFWLPAGASGARTCSSSASVHTPARDTGSVPATLSTQLCMLLQEIQALYQLRFPHKCRLRSLKTSLCLCQAASPKLNVIKTQHYSLSQAGKQASKKGTQNFPSTFCDTTETGMNQPPKPCWPLGKSCCRTRERSAERCAGRAYLRAVGSWRSTALHGEGSASDPRSWPPLPAHQSCSASQGYAGSDCQHDKGKKRFVANFANCLLLLLLFFFFFLISFKLQNFYLKHTWTLMRVETVSNQTKIVLPLEYYVLGEKTFLFACQTLCDVLLKFQFSTGSHAELSSQNEQFWLAQLFLEENCSSSATLRQGNGWLSTDWAIHCRRKMFCLETLWWSLSHFIQRTDHRNPQTICTVWTQRRWENLQNQKLTSDSLSQYTISRVSEPTQIARACNTRICINRL